MLIVVGIFGLIIGSFLNVLILRRGTGQGVGGRSACMSCGYQLRWYDLIPVASWLMLRGRCRSCGSRISIQYPLVEMATALLFATIAASPIPTDIAHAAVSYGIGSLLIAITVYDLKHTIIPDVWVYAFILLAFLSAPVFSSPILYSFFHLLLSGPIAASPLFLLWLVSRGRWMGFGDVKLAIGIGFLLGPLAGLVAVMLAFMIGGVVSAPLLFLSSAIGRRVVHYVSSHRARFAYTMKSEVPFGPFLVAATLVLWFVRLYGVSLPI